MMKYYPALVAAVLLVILALMASQWGCCEDVEVVADREAVAVPTIQATNTKPLNFPPTTVVTIDCILGNDGSRWARAHYPGRSVAELAYVHMYADTRNDGEYELVSHAVIGYEWIAVLCEQQQTSITFVMTDYLDQSSG